MTDIKIKGTGVETSKPAVSGGGGVSSHKTDGGSFADSVKGARRNLLDGELKTMLDQTRAIGEQFLKAPDETKLDKYKSALREYLNRASKEMFSLKQEFGPAQQGQQKVYQLIETVDKEIDNLTRDSLQKDKALTLLGSLDDIRGLILDLIT